MATFANDYSRGTASQTANRSALETLVGSSLLEDQNPYATFDFHNDVKTIYVELKTRFIEHDRYATALIGANKVRFCTDPNKSYFFVWAYTDGLYYIKYDPTVFQHIECRPFVRNSRADYNDVEADYYFIPHTLLSKV